MISKYFIGGPLRKLGKCVQNFWNQILKSALIITDIKIIWVFLIFSDEFQCHMKGIAKIGLKNLNLTKKFFALAGIETRHL